MQRLIARFNNVFQTHAKVLALLPALLALACLIPLPLDPSPALASQSNRKTDAQAHSPPNIILITTDDMDVASLATMPKTKALLADEGITFLESYVNFPVGSPSRASLLTGLAAHNHGVVSNSFEKDNGGFPTFVANGWEDKNIGTWFQNGGYATGFIGRVMDSYGDGAADRPATHILPGWDKWNGLPALYNPQGYFDYAVNKDGVIEFYGHRKQDYKTDVLAGKAVDFINAQAGAGQPFFLLLAPNAPHGSEIHQGNLGPFPAPRHVGAFSDLPFPRPPSFNEKNVSDKPAWVRALPRLDSVQIEDLKTVFRRRREALLAVDDMVEAAVNALTNNGVLDNTYIIFTSDNGYTMGEHRAGNAKKMVYEESVRVPLLVRGPGVPKGESRSQLVNNLDVVATMADWSHVTPTTVLDGRSLRPIIADSSASWRTAFLLEGTDGKYFHNREPYARYVAVRTSNGRTRRIYVEHESSVFGPEEELYDLINDPYELRNVASKASYGSIVSHLHRVLQNLSSCSGATCWFDRR